MSEVKTDSYRISQLKIRLVDGGDFNEEDVDFLKDEISLSARNIAQMKRFGNLMFIDSEKKRFEELHLLFNHIDIEVNPIPRLHKALCG